MGRHGHYQGACGSSQAVSLPVMRSNGAALPLLVAQRRLCFWSSRHCARCVSTCMVVPICLPECPCCFVAMPLMCLRACVPMMPQVLPLWSSPSPPPSPSSPCMRALLSPAPLSTSALIPGALRVAVPAFASPERPRHALAVPRRWYMQWMVDTMSWVQFQRGTWSCVGPRTCG
jgi:hypothetical protein